jgi:hypothetical protein
MAIKINGTLFVGSRPLGFMTKEQKAEAYIDLKQFVAELSDNDIDHGMHSTIKPFLKGWNTDYEEMT